MSRWLFLTLILLASTAFSAIERVTYFVNDANGSPLLEVNDAGLVIAEAEYRPYGESQDAVRRTGREATIGYADSLNQQDGIQAMGVRLYAPELGRFVSPDPVGYLDKGMVHFGRYHYANNNPYKYVDPDGEAALPLILLMLGGFAYTQNVQTPMHSGDYHPTPASRALVFAPAAVAAAPLAATAGALRSAAVSTPAMNGQFVAGALASRAATTTLQAQTRGYLALKGVGDSIGSAYASGYIGGTTLLHGGGCWPLMLQWAPSRGDSMMGTTIDAWVKVV